MRGGRHHAATWIGAGFLAAAGALGVAAVVVAGADSTELSAPAASLADPPVTIPPAVVAGPTGDAAGVVGSSSIPGPSTIDDPVPAPTTGAPTTTLPRSALAARLGDPVSVVPVPPVVIAPPVHLRIDAIGVDVGVRPVGLEDDGQLEIPDETEVGWYRLGATPGEAGAAVLAGHVNWNRVDGPFVRLRELEPGATVVVTRSDASTRTYQVVERQQYPKDALPAARIWTQGGPESLVLITCGGSFNPDIRRFRDNVVVYAVPVG